MTTPTFQLFRSNNTDEEHGPGSVIFSVGDPGQCMYAVLEGEVDLTVGNEIVETVSAGGIFGEMALIEHEARSATATARTQVRLARIDEQQFEFMTRNTPGFAFNMLRLVSHRLREADRRL